MALPVEIKEEAVARVTAYCAAKDPAEHADKIRFIEPAPSLTPLLDELDKDPTGIFWG